MRFENEGMALWYGLPDTPAPEGAIPVGTDITATIAVKPADASNRVELVYRRDQGAVETVPAKWLRHDLSNNSQYFRARFPVFRVGDVVEYTAVCYCAGRQVPSRSEAEQLASSFHVIASEVDPTVEKASKPPTPPVNIAVQHVSSSGEPLSQPSSAMPLPDSTPKADAATVATPSTAGSNNSHDLPSSATPVASGSFFALRSPAVQPMPNGSSASAGVDANTYTVMGTVANSNHAGVGGLRILVVDKNVGQDVLLAEGITDGHGSYRIQFSSATLRQRGKEKPDLQVRVYTGEKFLVASAVRYNATNHETLNVELPVNSVGLQSEYEMLTGTLVPHYNGRLSDLKESDDRQDITYLANKTGWDARAVALAALAAHFSQHRTASAGATGIQPAFYYALFRAGLPANSDTLYATDVQMVSQIWQQAIEQGVIPQTLGHELPNAVQAFQRLSAAYALDTRALTGASSLKEMLHLTLGDDVQRQQQFADLYTRYRSDLPTFWSTVRQAFGEQTTRRLQLDGLLGYLTLNNAPLIARLYNAEQQHPLTSMLDLAQRGYYQPAKWEALLDGVIPGQIPGSNIDEQRANYAEMLAAQVRVTFPTAVIADIVKNGEVPIPGGPDIQEGVSAFLIANQGQFEIGIEPIERYLVRTNLADSVATPVVEQIKLMQRVYQITPTEQAFTVLLKHNLNSAYEVTRYDEAAFVRSFKDEMGGEAIASLTYTKALEVYSAVLNIASTYLTACRAPALGSNTNARILSPAPIGPQPGTAPVVAYPTLEDLFGSMDYCTCDECRSILSPAAYLVDLLQFIYCPSPQKQNPQAVLFGRRPDIQYLPLTCENTNTALPYIDLVNETLEYFVANSLSLANYTGHNTDGTIPSDELLASPQFENDPASITAYTMLKSAYFPPPLPFHQPLELLRLHFQKFGIQLQDAMAALRSSDAIEGGTAAYGWQDILIEQIGVSRSEYQLLTDSALTLQQIYGYSTLSDSAVIAALSNFQNFSRRVGVSYDDLISILKTHFINPSSMLIPRLERLNVPFTTLQELKNGTLSDADFEALLPAGINPAEYGGNIPAWVKDPTNYARIMRIITIADPSGSNNLCPIEVLQFRYANPDTNANTLHAIDFVRLLRFIRLWRKLGLTIEQTDDVITALYPASNLPTGTNDAADLQNLDAGFKVLLLRIGFAFQVMNRLQLKADQDLPGLLACWAPIGTFGEHSLYRTMFLTPTLLKQDPAFADDGYGNFLQDSSQTLFAHEPALRAALNLTGAEFALITNTLGFDAATLLTLPNISAVYRQGWMARMLKLSVVEFLLLTRFTGLDPFAALDPAPVPPTEPPTIRLIRLVQALRAASLKPVQALYLIWNQDISGISAPPDAKITGLARTLRADFAAVESQFALVDDPNGDIAKALMVLVYGTNATDFFFGLLNNTLSVSVSYDNKEPMLPQPVLDAASGRLSYDDLRKQLTYTGVLDVDTLAALESTIGTNGPLKDAVDKLAAANHEVVDPFFAAYPELGPLYTTYVTSNASPQTKRTELLQQFLPDLKRRRKQEQALAAMTAAAGTDSSYAPVLLDDVTVLHAAPDPNIPHRDQLPVIYDLTDVEASGLSVQFFLTNNLAAPADITVNAVPTLSYAAKGSNPLPTGNGGSPIAGIWRGYLDAPQNGFYKISVATDPDALVALEIDGVEVPMDPPNVSSSAWSNASPISLTAGVLTSIALTVTTLTNTLTVSWQSTGIGRQVIPGTYLYPAILVDHLRTAYVRFLKATSLATSLSLKADEIAYLASNGDFQVNGQGWLNTLSVSGSPDTQTAIGLRDILCAVLDFARIKAALSPNDERLLSVLKQPEALLPNGDSALLTLTRWDQGSLNALLTLFFPNVPTPLANLAHLENFRRVYDAYAFVTACGISAAALISALTNDPTAQTVSDFQAALRARYAEADWLTVIKPINDTMRVRQRDALVAYILQHFGDQPPTICDNVLEKIDTPDKLFEFFLMDVEMDSCMQTSRIRHALSSVQLFIERCLRNLEPCVDSSDIQAAQWEWMKRYRVWEANRKVFLWPENWLDPELRDDQSQFFKDTMSELLQSDITDDAAQTALLNYLTKLEEVAKLEVCGTYYVESCDPEKTNDIVHVVARTAGAHRKYYYRRLEFGTWTPWEQIKLDIEDNPIIPVVWKGRLLLFWLQILKQTPIDPNSMSAPLPSSDPNATLANQPLSSLQAGLRSNATAQSQITVQAVLCWSEYYNGKWQPMKTSDVSRPTTLGLFSPTGSGAFDRAPLQLGVSEEGNDALLRVSIFGYGSSSFLLYNTHSLPVRQEDAPKTPSPSGQSQERRMYSYGYYRDYALVLTYGTVASPDSIWRSVLAEGTGSFYPIPLTIIQPSNPLQNVWDSPFFFQDSRHVFFVTTTDQQVWVPDSPSYGIAVKPSFIQVAKIPPLILPTDPHVQLESKLQNESSKIGPDSGIIDPAATRRFVTEDAFINQGFGTTIRVMYGDRQIGPLGTLPTSHTEV